MISVYPRVEVVGLGEIDLREDIYKNIWFREVPIANAYVNPIITYGTYDINKEVNLKGIFLPTDEIFLIGPTDFKVLRLANSIVSSGSRFPYVINNFKFFDSAYGLLGSGICSAVLTYKDRINVLYQNNIEPIRAHPFWHIQDTYTWGTASTSWIEVKRIDLGNVATRNLIAYFELWAPYDVNSPTIRTEISEDGTTWTAIGESWSYYGDAYFAMHIAGNISFRYVRFLFRIQKTDGGGSLKIRKLYIFE